MRFDCIFLLLSCIKLLKSCVLNAIQIKSMMIGLGIMEAKST